MDARARMYGTQGPHSIGRYSDSSCRTTCRLALLERHQQYRAFNTIRAQGGPAGGLPIIVQSDPPAIAINGFFDSWAFQVAMRKKDNRRRCTNGQSGGLQGNSDPSPSVGQICCRVDFVQSPHGNPSGEPGKRMRSAASRIYWRRSTRASPTFVLRIRIVSRGEDRTVVATWNCKNPITKLTPGSLRHPA